MINPEMIKKLQKIRRGKGKRTIRIALSPKVYARLLVQESPDHLVETLLEGYFTTSDMMRKKDE